MTGSTTVTDAKPKFRNPTQLPGDNIDAVMDEDVLLRRSYFYAERCAGCG